MIHRRRLLQSAALLAAPAWAVANTPPPVLRFGVATGGVGNPVRWGGSTTALVRNAGEIERALAADGTKVEWIFFKGAGPAVNEAFVNKQIDLAWQGDLPSIVHRANGVKTRILVGSGVRAGLYLAVPTGSDITKLEDLRGKRVAVFKGTNLHLAAVRALDAHGLKESDVRLVNFDLAGGQAALAAKDIDAAFGYVELFALQDRGAAKVVWSAHGDSYRFTRQLVILGRDEFVQQHPQLAQKVVTAHVKVAREWADESRRADLFEEWGKAEQPAALWRQDFIGQPLKVRLSPLLDPFLVARYEDAAEEAFRLKLIRSKPEVKSWFDRRFVDAAIQQLGQQDYWPAYGADGKLLGSQSVAAAR
ncbi:MAG TPA: ABC transporter substrate-binding protein [Rubrivivax sp.]|jgi:sulfonate transport system substrate-binding protein|nr:ABC transporter substrate-binding protein [Rubrivivax sp.]